MEQPIGKNPPLVDAAAIDPAHVPGLATPIALTEPGAVGRPDGDGRKEPRDEPRAVPGDVTDDDTPDDRPDAVPKDTAGTDDTDDTDGTDGTEESGKAEVPDGPVFEVSDRRGSILVDGTGVSFTLDDQAAEWTWDEIGAVEYTTTRFSRRLTVYVHTPDRRWYPNEIQAPARGVLTEWTERLDAALDAWFEDEEPSAAGTSDEAKDGSAGATAVALVKTAERAGGGKVAGGKAVGGKPGSGSGSGGGGDFGSSGS
ncbi:hypothetical protein ACIQXD_08160 [Streptomyces uncialis]|uniref:hypothetical protein n=1 Tax=Streptomyces uncialis TaxID=1048205 RepID=UPI00381BC8B1